MQEDAAASAEPSPSVAAPGARLTASDIPIDRPLDWTIVTPSGGLLLTAGARLHSDAARQFLLAHFEPHRQKIAVQSDLADTAPPSHSHDTFTLDDIGLKIGARLGLRRQAGSAMYSSRVIGFSSAAGNRSRAVFITQPLMSGHEPLDMVRGEKVELVAITPRAVFHFACTVDAVCSEPFTYYVLSEPGAIRRLRARKFGRMSTHLPVRFYNLEGAESDKGSVEVGMARDISPFGMSLSVPDPRAKPGDRLKLSFNFNTDDVDVMIDCIAFVRHVNPLDAKGLNGSYGLEFEALEPSQRIALKSFMAEQS